MIPHINKQFNSELTLDDIKEYDLTSALPHLEPGEFYSWFREAESAIYASSPVSENAKNILNQWKERYELFYISARGENVSDITLEWFKKHAIAYDHIELIGSHNKIETAKKHNVHLFFEDKHDNAVDISEELDIPVILFDTPYNRLPVPKNVIRVYNWLEAEEFVSNEFALEELKTK
nr:hypothetical protein [Planococcus beigongshangi]